MYKDMTVRVGPAPSRRPLCRRHKPGKQVPPPRAGKLEALRAHHSQLPWLLQIGALEVLWAPRNGVGIGGNMRP